MPAISFLPFLQNIPFATRILTLNLLFFTLSGILLATLASGYSDSPPLVPGVDMPWLVLVPGASYWYPWTLVTAGWVELSIFELVFSLISLPLACRYLEKIWGPWELIRFCTIVIAGGNLIAFGFSWLVYIVTRQEEAIFGLPFHGLSGLQVGFLVAFTQLIPEHQLQVLGVLKVRVKTLPGIYLLVSNVLVFLLGSSPYMLIQFGFFVAWAYLRFFKLYEDGTIRGDRSETFSFQYWFPPPVRPYISKAANFVFRLAVRAKVVQPWDEPIQSGGYNMLPGPGGARAEAERRRALALKALDARLASGSPAPGVPSPNTSMGAAPPTAAAAAAQPGVVPSVSAPPVSAPALKSSPSSRSVTQVTGADIKKDEKAIE